MEDTGCQVAGFWVRMDALSGPWRWASRCDWRSFSAVSRPSLIVSSMGDRDEGRPESEKDRVCSVWYAMGIRDYGRPKSEKRQSECMVCNGSQELWQTVCNVQYVSDVHTHTYTHTQTSEINCTHAHAPLPPPTATHPHIYRPHARGHTQAPTHNTLA